jgi:ATP-dependent DNA helicase RecG
VLTDAELEALLFDRESSRVERKESLALDAAKETACAFANDISNSGLAGILFFGIRDDGTCAGITIDDKLLLRGGEIRADGNLLPAPFIEVEERVVAGCRLMVVQVAPHRAPPVRFKGRAFIRVGPRNQVASPEEERILNERRRGGDLSFDSRGFDGASLDDLDLLRFQERYLRAAVNSDVIAENERSVIHQMMSLRLIDPNGVPTPGGILIVGKDPERLIPGAYVQFNRFDGTKLTDDIIDTKRLSGTLDDQLRAIDELLKLNIRTEVDITSSDREIRSADYPVGALQQLTRNAVMHRNYQSNAPARIYWYSDRVEIQNPGGLYGQVNPGNFGTTTDYRNPLIAEGMRNYGFVQKFGVGIATARKLLMENGSAPPEFQLDQMRFSVTVKSR